MKATLESSLQKYAKIAHAWLLKLLRVLKVSVGWTANFARKHVQQYLQ